MDASALSRGLPLPRSARLLAPLGDDRLVEQVRRGNEAAFEAIYERHHRGILSFCRHMLGSREEAEDAVQHTFAAAYRSLLDEDREVRLAPWLYAIARNRCLSVLRARRERVGDVPEISTAGLSEEVERRSDLRDLVRDLSDLREPQRAALVLTELGDLPHADVAQVLDCEVEKVKSLVFQARTALMERRRAREIPCAEIREQLATARGGALRRGPLRRHLRACPGCAAFRDEVRRQRRMMAAVLPVVPTLGLKESALAAAGLGGGGAAGGGLVAAGGGLGAVAGSGTAKVVVVALALGGAGTGAAVSTVGSEGGVGDRPSTVAGQAPAGNSLSRRPREGAPFAAERGERGRGSDDGDGRGGAKSREGKRSEDRRRRAKADGGDRLGRRTAPKVKRERSRVRTKEKAPRERKAPLPSAPVETPVLPPVDEGTTTPKGGGSGTGPKTPRSMPVEGGSAPAP